MSIDPNINASDSKALLTLTANGLIFASTADLAKGLVNELKQGGPAVKYLAIALFILVMAALLASILFAVSVVKGTKVGLPIHSTTWDL